MSPQLIKNTVSMLTLAILISVAGSSCRIDDTVPVFSETAFRPSNDAGKYDTVKPLIVTLAVNDVYCKDTACKCVHSVAARQYKDIQSKLKKECNIDLRLIYFMDPYDLEKSVISKKYDGFICKPWLVYASAPGHNWEYKRIADVLGPEDNQWLTGVFMVRKDSPIKKLEDIVGKNLVIGQYDSYEKYHEALRMLDEKGIKPGKITHKASCLESIGELLDGNADMAVVSSYTWSATCAVDFTKPEDFRIIVTTPKIPLTSVILDTKKVDKKNASRLQNALLKFSGKNSPETMLSHGFVKPAPWTPKPYPMPKESQ